MKINRITLAMCLPALAWTTSTFAIDCVDERCDEHLVITADLSDDSLITITDPKLPRQPLPSFDGSGYLKTIPGFSVTRKGGAGGDISLRGLAGSRISIINDGQQLAGTCGGRMDPPTNYISPETYEQVVVIKGPQTVRYGPVGSAGTILFERDHYGFTERAFEGRASITAGSFGRQDYLSELLAGNEHYYWSLDINGSKSDDFKDGDGKEIQSRYDRQSLNTAVGITSGFDGLVELRYGTSSGDAEYADRANKARTIDNENWSLIAEKTFNDGILTELKFQGYWNENDHIMDQFDRPIDENKPLPVGMNPRRTTYGGYVWAELDIFNDATTLVGIDHLDQVQDMRGGTSLDALLSASYQDVFAQQNWGAFAELEYALPQGMLFTGLRLDRWQTELLGSWASTNKINQRDDTFLSGYARYEHNLNAHKFYVGLGHAERIPDYWETMKAMKTLTLDSEKTDQIDLGWAYSGRAAISASLFYAALNDYILIDTQSTPNARNIDATLFGGELALTYPVTDRLTSTLTVAYSHGDNDTDHVPLGQVSPLEGRLMLNYQANDWSFGSLWRLVASQDRVAIGQGNIVGQDLDTSAGFGILSLNGTYTFDEQFQVSFGIDNLFDKTYAEHVSKTGAGNDALPIENRTKQVNEPGRTLWAKLDYEF